MERSVLFENKESPRRYPLLSDGRQASVSHIEPLPDGVMLEATVKVTQVMAGVGGYTTRRRRKHDEEVPVARDEIHLYEEFEARATLVVIHYGTRIATYDNRVNVSPMGWVTGVTTVLGPISVGERMITLGLQGAGAEFRGFPLTKEKQTAIRGVLKRKAGGYLNYTTSPGRGEGIVNRLLNQQARVQSKTKTACWMPKELLFAMRERGETEPGAP
jgi:hypothetical protein